jgi:hypothetical protein
MARFTYLDNNNVSPGPDVEDKPPIPAGEVWCINRVVFADQADGALKSGGFMLEYGNGTTWDFIAAAWLTGNTIEFKIDRDFTGDGTNHFRVTRQNTGSAAKRMTVWVEGFTKG